MAAGDLKADIKKPDIPIVEMSQIMREKYGKFIDHMTPAMKGYQGVFVLSDAEMSTLKLAIGLPETTNKSLVDLTKKLYPALEPQLSKLDPKGVETFGKTLKMLVQQDLQKDGPASASVQLGSPANPIRLGALMLPEKPAFELPSSGRSLTYLEGLAKEEAVRAVVVSHEIGHLVYGMRRGEFAVNFEMTPEFEAQQKIPRTDEETLPAEIASDRFTMKAMAAMRENGLIKDPSIEIDFLNFRRLQGFSHLIGQGYIIPSGLREPGELPVQNAIEGHGTGFSLGQENDERAEFKRLSKAAEPILAVRDAALTHIFQEATQGKGNPGYVNAYNQVTAIQGKSATTIDHEFKDEVSKKADFVHDIAEKMEKMTSLAPESQALVQDYLAAYKHFFLRDDRAEMKAAKAAAEADTKAAPEDEPVEDEPEMEEAVPDSEPASAPAKSPQPQPGALKR